MHWRNKTRDWSDADADRVSFRLVEGLDDLLATIEDRGGGQIDYVRLRKPPTGATAKRTKSRYIGWDNLDGCAGHSAREIAAELTAAAVHLSAVEKCGCAFEAQVTFTAAGQPSQQRSISFNLDDGPMEGEEPGDKDNEAERDELGQMSRMLSSDPIALLMVQNTEFNRRLVELADKSRQVEQSRYDRLLAAFLDRSKVEESVVERVVKMLDPLMLHAARMTELGFEALTGQAESIRAAKEVEAEVEIKKQRLETIKDGFAGIKDLINGFGLELLAHKLGVDPADLRKAAAASATPQDSSQSESEPSPSKPMSMDPDQSNKLICQKAIALRESLTSEQLNAIAQIHESIAQKLQALDAESTADEIKAVFGEIKDVIASDRMLMLGISNELNGEQQLAVLQLLNIIYGE